MSRPNILHIFTDMQRADTIAALGNPVIRTPNLDRLAQTGVAFDNAFTPSPVCVSARCSMIFGQYPWTTGTYLNSAMPTDDRETFMGALTNAGYRTHGIGKCHFTPEKYALRGFQTRESQAEGGAPVAELEQNDYLKYLYDRGYRHVVETHGVRGEMYYMPQVSQLPAADHPTQWIGDRSIKFIENQGKETSPWYLFSSFIHPHPPFTPPTPWHKIYRPSLMPLPSIPQDADELLTLVNRIQNRYKYRDKGTDINLQRLIVSYYYACISFIDFQIGRILDALESSGQLDSTLIVFTSDHGEYLGDYGSFGKRSMHDPSARVPLLARLPGVFEGGKRIDTPVSLVDLAPTFLRFGEATLPGQKIDGIDLADVVRGDASREYVYSEHSIAQSSIDSMCRDSENDDSLAAEEKRARNTTYMTVSSKWKYFYSAPDDREFLFDRIGDPLETRNRVGVEFCRDARENAKQDLIATLKAAGETAGLNGNDWRRFPRITIDSEPDTGLLIQDGYTPWAEMDIAGYTE